MTTERMSPQAVNRRLVALSRAADLRAGRRLDSKVDLSGPAVEYRLRRQAMLRTACRRWADAPGGGP